MTKTIRNHLDGKKDSRYAIALEWCGQPEQRHVARFCGEYIGQGKTQAEAFILAQEHYDNHKIDATYTQSKEA